MGERTVGLVERCPDGGDEPPREGARPRHGHLLAEHRPHRELGAVHGARDPSTWGVGDGGRQQGVPAQDVGHRHRVGIEVEETTAPLDGGAEVAQVVEPQGGDHVALLVPLGHAQCDGPRTTRQPERAAVGAVGRQRFHAGHGPGPEEREQPGAVERRPEGQAHRDRAGRRLVVHPAARPELGRALGEDRPDRVVELADAGEPGTERHL